MCEQALVLLIKRPQQGVEHDWDEGFVLRRLIRAASTTRSSAWLVRRYLASRGLAASQVNRLTNCGRPAAHEGMDSRSTAHVAKEAAKLSGPQARTAGTENKNEAEDKYHEPPKLAGASKRHKAWYVIERAAPVAACIHCTEFIGSFLATPHSGHWCSALGATVLDYLGRAEGHILCVKQSLARAKELDVARVR